MPHPQDLIRLYSTILFQDIRRDFVTDDDMKAAIDDMQQVYRAESGKLTSTVRRLADYNSTAYRCAYLHKYASFHTAMVQDIMKCILQENVNIFRVFQERFAQKRNFRICSLGGGPGSDIVGFLITMFEHFGLFPCDAKVIDIKSDWKDTLSSVIRGLSAGMCGPVGEGFSRSFFNWEYLTADLLDEVHDDIKSAIGSADLVTMVKFVSAAACESTEWMLKKIFTKMKLGGVVLFIDNSAGGFRQVVSKAASDCNLTTVFGPVNYQVYTNEAFKITHWGLTSCYSTTVTIHMMQKLRRSPPFTNITPKRIVNLAPKSNNQRTNVNKNDKTMKCSDLEAENAALQAKLKELQEKNINDRNDSTTKIAELEKTVSTNKKILTETIQDLEKYKADVVDYKTQLVSAKEEIVNLKKELELAKILQEQSAFRERQIQVTDVDVNITEQADTKLQEKEQLKNANEKGKKKRTLSDANKDNAEIKGQDDENSISPKRRRVLRSKQPMVIEPLNNLKIPSEDISPPKTRTSRRKLQEQENMAPEPVKNSTQFVDSVAHSVSSMSSPRVTRGSKVIFNEDVELKKTHSKHAQSVCNMSTPRVTRVSQKLFHGTKEETPKITQSVYSLSSPRGSKELFNDDVDLRKTQPKHAQSVCNMSTPRVTRVSTRVFKETKEETSKITQLVCSLSSPRVTRGNKELFKNDVDFRKTQPKHAQSVPSPRVTRASTEFFNNLRKTLPKHAQSVCSLSTPRVTHGSKELFNDDVDFRNSLPKHDQSVNSAPSLRVTSGSIKLFSDVPKKSEKT